MLILKQSTSIDIRMGPFVDATDGVTPETGITLGAADQAEVLKANGAATAAMAGTFAAVTGADGWYDYTVATGDVDTVGEVVFVVQDSSVCLPVLVRGYVVEEAVYDDFFAASADNGVAALATVDSNVDAVLVDTGTTLPASIATIDTNVDSILADTGTDGVLVSMAQSLPGSPTADTVGDALKQATRETAAKKNVALSNIPFKLVSSTNHVDGVTGASVTVEYAGDGATSWTSGGGTVAEIDNGVYTYDALQAEMNFDVVTFRFTATGADPREISIKTVE